MDAISGQDFIIAARLVIYLTAICIGAWVILILLEGLNTYLFSRKLRSAVLHSQPSWKEVCYLAENQSIKKKTVFIIAKRMYGNVISGWESNSGLAAHKELLEEYIGNYVKEEPFESFEPRARLALERIKKELGDDNHAFDSIVEHLSELMRFQNIKNKRQRFYTCFGFFVGVAGFVYTIFS